MAKIKDSLLQKQIGWKPTKPQQEILKANKRDTTVAAGVRFGKSMLSAYVILKHLLADNQKIWIVSLTYDMTMKVFNYVVDFAAEWDKQLLKGVSTRTPAKFVIKEWNSSLECKSADNENSLLGEELDLAVLDEASRMKPDIWQRFISARLTSRQGKSFMISTPFGQNWFYQRYLEAKEAKDGTAFHFTSKDNPYFPEEEWERAKRILPADIFQQEYEAMFLADAAAVFRNIENCIKSDCLKEPQLGHYYYLGLDLAKFNDFTVITVIDRDTHEVVFRDRFQKLPYTLQKERILGICRKYRATVVIDALNIGAAIGDELRAEGVNVIDFKAVGTISKDIDKQGTKEKLIEKLAMFFEDQNVWIPPQEDLIDELKSYGYKLTPAGNLVYGAPEGFHDDCVISLALAVWPIYGKTRTQIIQAKRSIPLGIKKFQYY